jgi:hypothetical protein
MVCMLLAVKTASKALVNLASRSRMRNWNRCPASSKSKVRLRASWVSHASVGCAVTPRMWTGGWMLDDEECVEPVQGDGVEVEQVAGEDPVGLGSEELSPRGSGSAG